MLLWAVHDGGYDADTWYWGALLLLAALAVVLIAPVPRRRLTLPGFLALSGLTAYVVWSYASILWAQAPGTALEGSNRALLYLLLFALLACLPWTIEGALVCLLSFAIGVGIIAVVLLVRLASADQVQNLFDLGRLAAPTGYLNATAALFTMQSLTSIALASRRELPGVLRGLLLALSAAGLQLAITAQSRGWLFTLPIVVLAAVFVTPNRVRFVSTAVLPALAAVIPVHKLADVFSHQAPGLIDLAARRAGHTALLLCIAVFVAGTLVAWVDKLARPRTVSPGVRRGIGVIVVTAVLAAGLAGASLATHGHPIAFAKKQLNGFSHDPRTVTTTGSHFAVVGSGRYDFWRVALDSFLSHPLGGLGQDNFADYYLTRRRTSEEPAWTHSLEMRLLAHTGIIGTGLFVLFLVSAMIAALKARSAKPGIGATVTAAAMVPGMVWLIHGSVDWFWEMPALTAPALGFLAIAGALKSDPATKAPVSAPLRRPRLSSGGRRIGAVAGVALGAVTMAVLGAGYLSVRETSLASDLAPTNPTAALRDLSAAASLNPLSATPVRLAGTIALASGRFAVASQRFQQSLDRERGGWYAWLGAGLSASALGQPERARRDFEAAYRIDRQQPAIGQALARAHTAHPLTYPQAEKLLILHQ